MDYTTYLARGWMIGSGPVEAACKLVVGRRLKGTGMRWRPPRSDSLCHLRASSSANPASGEPSDTQLPSKITNQ
jgi:hypothetical protein